MATLKREDLPDDGFWHVLMKIKGSLLTYVVYDLTKDEVLIRYVCPHRLDEELMINGRRATIDLVGTILIAHTKQRSSYYPDKIRTYETNYITHERKAEHLYKDIFGINQDDEIKDYTCLLSHFAIDLPYGRRARLTGRNKAVSINVSNQNNIENSISVSLVQQHYVEIEKLIDAFSLSVKELKRSNAVTQDVVDDAIEVSNILDSISKSSDQSVMVNALRKGKRLLGDIKEVVSNGSEIASAITTLIKLFNM